MKDSEISHLAEKVERLEERASFTYRKVEPREPRGNDLQAKLKDIQDQIEAVKRPLDVVLTDLSIRVYNLCAAHKTHSKLPILAVT